MQNADQDADELSFFRIAGIHGLPYEPWNGAGEKPLDPETRWAGYCVHGSTLFPTWHRPYMALFEVRQIFFPYHHYTDPCIDSKLSSNKPRK